MSNCSMWCAIWRPNTGRFASVDRRLVAEIDSRALAAQKACRNTAVLVRAAADTGPDGTMLCGYHHREHPAQVGRVT